MNSYASNVHTNFFCFYLDSFLSPSSGAGGAVNNDENSEIITSMDLDIVPSNPQQEQNFPCERVPFEEPHEWCRISYYEMSNRVGEQFRATQSQVIIDGFTHPSNAERFCLGGLPNVQRTSEIDRARRYIGRGVKLFHTRGNVFAECVSDNPVFVQSPITNKRFAWHPATVCKIPPSKYFSIKDSNRSSVPLTTTFINSLPPPIRCCNQHNTRPIRSLLFQKIKSCRFFFLIRCSIENL
jgi:hypothetical protein